MKELEELKKEIKELKISHSALRKELSANYGNENWEATIKEFQNELDEHIKVLHTYNETKDATMSMVKLIALQRDTTIGEVMNEIGIVED